MYINEVYLEYFKVEVVFTKRRNELWIFFFLENKKKVNRAQSLRGEGAALTLSSVSTKTPDKKLLRKMFVFFNWHWLI